MKYIVAIIIFTVVIMFHEWGHFLLARKNGVTVDEFCLGFGPTLLKHKKGDTTYSIRLFWLGGACVMRGEDEEVEDDPGSFNSKGVLARMSIVFAGPFFNFILAFLLSVCLIAICGYDEPVIVGTLEGTNAATVGFEEGDRIVSINHKKINVRREATMYMYFHPSEVDEELTIVYERDGQRYSASFLPTYLENEDGTGAYYMGLSLYPYRTQANVFTAVKYGLCEVRYWICTTIDSLRLIFTGGVSANQVSGPVGIVKSIGDTYTEAQSGGFLLIFVNMLNITILLTANLGVMNLLPLPALDGGRLLFLIVELIRRKKIDQEKEGLVHLIGFGLLLALMVLVLFNDIRNLFL